MVHATNALPPPVVRQPLQPLPATPLNKRITPIYTKSSPCVPVCVPAHLDQISSHLKDVEILTPPHTPLKTSCASDYRPVLGTSIQVEGSKMEKGKHINEVVETATFQDHPSWSETMPKPYLRKYKLLGSASAGYEEFGRGVWSAVYRAEEVADFAPVTGLLTPPTSPLKTVGLSGKRQYVAVKAPIRRDAYRVLENEARVLTYLHRNSAAKGHIIGFHGYNPTEHALVLDACPVTLAAHCAFTLKDARKNFATKTMSDPVIGVDEWARLAKALVGGLEFLHRVGCVHGDIKPANVLLQFTNPASFYPLYCDFSSAHIICADSTTEIEEVTAVTADFTSPELLASFYRRNSDRAVATFASDVFALGVTLLVAATGESPYAGARMEMQKLSMAKEGVPLSFARAGDQASRVMRLKMVERFISRALDKNSAGRISAAEWNAEAAKGLAV